MTIGYYTDNNVSHAVMKALSAGGIRTAHIKDFDPFNVDDPVFYGILRGAGSAIRHLQFIGANFYYIDNGYFDALYMGKGKIKEMGGKYRIVKNALIDTFPSGNFITPVLPHTPLRFLLLPPSHYTAFMHDTTPEDWTITWGQKIHDLGHSRKTRDKTETIPLEDELANCDAVFAFNSMAVIKAIEMGKVVYTTHGVIQNSDFLGKICPTYSFEDIKRYFGPKNFTLEEIARMGVKCLG